LTARITLAVLGVLALIVFCGAASAVEPNEMLHDPILEARARQLSQGLRCLVCQNQSIDDSSAPLAEDLRVLLRERLTAGDSDAQAVAFLVSRYGNFVLLKPPFQFDTFFLWAGPGLILLIAAMGFGRFLAANKKSAAWQLESFSADDENRLDELMRKERTI
jgi:cytochrome c-type biogenesis protein CcmH